MKVEKLAITDRDTWLGWRRQDVTASDIGAICGLSEYKTALGVWAEKAGTIEPEENDAMRTGRYLEDAVVAYMREAHPNWQIVKPQLYYRAPEHRLGATPDAMANDEHGRRVNIQAKSVARPQYDKWEGTPPLAYQLQVAAEAMLMEADYSILAVMTKEFRPEFHEYRIDRNAKAEARVLDMVAEFWASVEKGETPAVDFSRDLQLVTKLKPPKPELDPINFQNDNHLPEILAELERLKGDEKEVAMRIKEIRAEIIDKLNGHPLGTCDGWKFRHCMRHYKAYTVAEHDTPVLTVTRERQQ
jgi:predicted phage-related endonuclease